MRIIRVICHYLCISLLAPFIAMYVASLLAEIFNGDIIYEIESLDHIIRFFVGVAGLSLFYTTSLLLYSIPLSAIYHSLLQSKKLKGNAKMLIIPSLKVVFPLVVALPFLFLHTKSAFLFGAMGGLVSILLLMPTLKSIWSREIGDNADESDKGRNLG